MDTEMLETVTSDRQQTNVADMPGQTLKRLSRWQRLGLDALLVFATMIWGGTFLVTQKTLQLCGPFTYLALCFAVGSLTLALIFCQQLVRISRRELFMGMVIGLFLFGGYTLQTNGLLYTTTSKAGFITGLYVPLVPVLSFIFLRQKPALKAIIGMGLSVVGLVLLSVNQQFNLQFGLGEALMVACAFAFAMHIVCIGKFVPDANPINLAIIQLATASLLCFIAVPIAGEPIAAPPSLVLVVVLLMGVVDFAFCFMMMNRAQQYMSSTRAALVYALEPVWAAFFGLLVGQYPSLLAWIGCGFILLGMVVGSIHFKKLNIKALRRATGQDD